MFKQKKNQNLHYFEDHFLIHIHFGFQKYWTETKLIIYKIWFHLLNQTRFFKTKFFNY